jgi:hypothetical protein
MKMKRLSVVPIMVLTSGLGTGFIPVIYFIITHYFKFRSDDFNLFADHLHLNDNVKMSKSLGNTISIKDFLKTNSPEHFRMMCLLSNYRTGTAVPKFTFYVLLKFFKYFLLYYNRSGIFGFITRYV